MHYYNLKEQPDFFANASKTLLHTICAVLHPIEAVLARPHTITNPILRCSSHKLSIAKKRLEPVIVSLFPFHFGWHKYLLHTVTQNQYFQVYPLLANTIKHVPNTIKA